jgi:hypothetical protein
MKRYRDRAVLSDSLPDPFPTFRRVLGRSFGVAIDGQLTRSDATAVQANYTFQRATERVGDVWSPTGFDTPHSLSVFASQQLGWHLRLTGVFAAHSGVAITPPEARLLVPASDFGGGFVSRYIIGARNSVRVPPFDRLDLGLRRTWNARGAEWSASFQALNVLYHRNQLDFDWFSYFCNQAARCRPEDTGRSGLPILPSIGLEVRW